MAWTRFTGSLILLVGFVLAAASCGDNASDEAAIRDSFEQSLQPFDEEFEQEWTELVGQCARNNGVQNWNEEKAHSGGEVITTGPPPGVAQRDYIAEHGSGIIEWRIESLNRDITNLPIPQEPATELSDNEVSILERGPIVTPDGESFTNGGCRPWATEVLTSRPEFTVKRQIAEDYSSFFADKEATSPELLSIELKWSRCMAENGFPGLVAQGDHLDVVREEAFALTPESPVDVALALDRAITLSAWDCSVELSDERYRLLDTFVTEFLESRDIDF